MWQMHGTLVPRDPSHRHRATLGCPRVLPRGGGARREGGTRPGAQLLPILMAGLHVVTARCLCQGLGWFLPTAPFQSQRSSPKGWHMSHTRAQGASCLCSQDQKLQGQARNLHLSGARLDRGMKGSCQEVWLAPNNWKSSPTPWDPHPASSSASSAEGEQQSNSSHTDQAHGSFKLFTSMCPGTNCTLEQDFLGSLSKNLLYPVGSCPSNAPMGSCTLIFKHLAVA